MRENGILQNKLAKCCAETGLSWVKSLPTVLMHMLARVRWRANLSPFEILFSRSMNTAVRLPGKPRLTTGECEDKILNYCINLSSVLSDVHKQVKDTLPKPNQEALHDLKPGEWVEVKDFRRKSWKAKLWQGPFQILLTTPSAVKVVERATRIHASHCKRVPVPRQEKRKRRHMSLWWRIHNELRNEAALHLKPPIEEIQRCQSLLMTVKENNIHGSDPTIVAWRLMVNRHPEASEKDINLYYYFLIAELSVITSTPQEDHLLGTSLVDLLITHIHSDTDIVKKKCCWTSWVVLFFPPGVKLNSYE